MPPAGPPRVSQSSMRTSQPTPIIVPKPKVKYSIVLRLPCSFAFDICPRTIAAATVDDETANTKDTKDTKDKKLMTTKGTKTIKPRRHRGTEKTQVAGMQRFTSARCDSAGAAKRRRGRIGTRREP